MSVAVLAACSQGSVQNALGMGKRSPDEFAVVSRAPLILPPDYGLRPPGPGESRPGVDTPSEQARARLVGQAPQASAGAGQQAPAGVGQQAPAGVGQQAPAGVGQQAPAGVEPEVVSAAFDQTSPVESSGERALVAQATSTATDPDIRRKIGEENMQLAQVEEELFTQLLAWRAPQTLGTTIDPAAETQRLRANRIEGKPATEGDSPVITQRRQSALQGILSEVF